MNQPVAATQPRRRRWFRFSLRTLFVFVTLVAVGAAWVAIKLGQAKQQREAVEAILKVGGSAAYDYEYAADGFSLVPNAAPFGPQWLSKLVGPDLFHNVVQVQLRGSRVRDDDLAVLVKLPKVKYLDVSNTQISDNGMPHLAKLHNLTTCLWLQGTKITDAGIMHLQSLSLLRCLEIEDTRVTYPGAQRLKRELPKCVIILLGNGRAVVADEGPAP